MQYCANYTRTQFATKGYTSFIAHMSDQDLMERIYYLNKYASRDLRGITIVRVVEDAGAHETESIPAVTFSTTIWKKETVTITNTAPITRASRSGGEYAATEEWLTDGLIHRIEKPARTATYARTRTTSLSWYTNGRRTKFENTTS